MEEQLQMITYVRESPKGVSLAQLKAKFSHLNAKDLMITINACLAMESGLVPFKDTKGEAWFKGKPQLLETTRAIVKGLDEQPAIVYRIIQNAHREGIWTKLIKSRAGPAANRTFPKILKSLEQKKLIKSFKSISMKNKRLYILYELEPAEHHVGDIWYNSEGDFDEAFVQILIQAVSKHMKTVNYVSLEQVRQYLTSTGIVKNNPLRESHIKTIMNTLMYDGLVESFMTPNGETNYKMTRLVMPVNGLTLTPCGICAVKHLCGKTSQITPEKCVYLTQWTDF